MAKRAKAQKAAEPARPAGPLRPIEETPAEHRWLSTDVIRFNPKNPRRFDASRPAFRELVDSVRAQGVVIPVCVVPGPADLGEQNYVLFAGERRVRAAIEAGRLSVPALVYQMSEPQATEWLYIENCHREDLTPMEQGRAVAGLLETHGGDHAAVAAILGQTPRWVAMRERLAELSPAWAKALESRRDDDAWIQRWGAGHLAVISRLDPEVQERVFPEAETQYSFARDVPSVAELEAWLNTEFLRLLKDAPWDLDDATLDARAGACSECPQRRSRGGLLFEEPEALADGRAAKRDQCLDSLCWSRKGLALARRWLAELKARGQKPIAILRGQWHEKEKATRAFPGAVDGNAYREVPEGTAGAVPAVIVSGPGSGTVQWLTSAREASARREMPGIPKTLAQRRDSLKARRQAWVVETVKKRLENHADAPKGLLALVAAFGTGDLHPQGWKAYEDLEADLVAQGGKTWKRLWELVRAEIAERLVLCGPSSAASRLGEAGHVAGLIGLEMAALEQQVLGEIPEPKSWKSLNADGTPKTKEKKSESAKHAKGTRKGEEEKPTPEAPTPAKSKAEKATEAKGERKCRICGCTEDDSCDLGNGYRCCWAEHDLCDNPACLKKAIAALDAEHLGGAGTLTEKKKLIKRIGRLADRRRRGRRLG